MSDRGKWSVPGVPHMNWRCIDVEDCGEDEADFETCGMCEIQEIRYVHLMQHDAYPNVLRCGCVCAGFMENDSAAARLRETAVRNQAVRRRNWLKRKWRVSHFGNEYINVDRFHVVVFPHAGGIWKGRIEDKVSANVLLAKRAYTSQAEAKLAAFDVLPTLRKQWRGEA